MKKDKTKMRNVLLKIKSREWEGENVILKKCQCHKRQRLEKSKIKGDTRTMTTKSNDWSQTGFYTKWRKCYKEMNGSIDKTEMWTVH